MHYYIAPSVGGLVFIQDLALSLLVTKLYRVWHTLIQFVTLAQDDDIPLHSAFTASVEMEEVHMLPYIILSILFLFSVCSS